MSENSKDPRTRAQLLEEIEQLQLRLGEAEQTLEAIRRGDIDALVVTGPRGEQVFSITGAEHIYRVIVETMNEAAVTVDPDGTVLFCNQRFCDLMKTPIHEILGRKVATFAARPQQPSLEALLTTGRAGAVQRRVTLRATDGTAVPVQISASPLRADDTLSICLVASDLTELEASANSIHVLREHQQALEESEARYHRLFEDDLTGDFISTPEGKILLCNPAFARIFGFSSVEEAVGTSILELYVEPTEREPLLQRLKQQGSIERLEVWRKRRDGEPIYIVENLVGHLNERGELYEIKGYIFDDTERKRAEEALRESREDLNRAQAVAHTGSWRLDTRRNVLLWSDETYRIFGIPRGTSMTYETFLAAVHPEDREYVDRKWTGALGGEPYDIEHRIIVGDTVKWVREKAELEFDSEVVLLGGFGTVQDITERRQTEEALRELTRTLESKVAQRTAELEYRARQLQKLTLELSEAEDRERKRLAEILHDDLQQILAAAKFHLNSVRNRVKYDPSVQATVAQVDHMLKDAIDKSRGLSHELSPAVLHHGDFTETLVWLATQVQIKHGLLVHVDAFSKVELQSDALKAFLYKAAQELLFNVVKHARVNEARIRIRRWGQCICLSVSDRGRGFDPQDLKATAGFGLFSIRERIELLGGRMKIKSAKGGGSTFHIVMPDGELIKKAAAIELADLAKEMKRAQGEGERRLRVLIADDHEIVREGLISLLSDEHTIQVVGEAANGREAVDLADRLRPDVVIMDVAMPLIDGDEATRQIKQHLPGTRVIALSMYEEHENVEKMLNAGAETYILKTAPSEELLAAIRGKDVKHTAAT